MADVEVTATIRFNDRAIARRCLDVVGVVQDAMDWHAAIRARIRETCAARKIPVEFFTERGWRIAHGQGAWRIYCDAVDYCGGVG